MLGEFPLNDADLFPPESTPAVEAGIIGWEDQDDVADVGDDSNGGVTLIRVQLFRGKDATSDVKPGVAQGHKLLCRLNGFPLWAIPPKGLQCYVLFPSGFDAAPGAGVIAAMPGINPLVQFSKTRAKLDMGDDQDLVLKARSVTISDYENRFLAVGPETGIVMSDADGVVIHMKDGAITIGVPDAPGGDAKTMIRMTVDQFSAANKSAAGVAGIKLEDGDVILAGGNAQSFTNGANIGPAATAATPAVIGVGTAAAVGAWMTALSAWMTAVDVATGTVNPGPPPLAGSATVNVQS